MISSPLSPLKVFERKHLKKDFLFSIISEFNAMGKIKVAFITDNAPIKMKNEFLESLDKKEATIFTNIQPNPCVTDIMGIFNSSEFKKCSVIVGIGGGSVLDSAKALAMLKTNGGNLNDYLGNTPKLKITKKSAPLILIPTTAGTGSEVTKVGVYTSDSGRKHTLGSPFMYADRAILVQDFILNAPAGLIASTGLDALDHALESIWNKNAKPETLALSRKAAIEVLTNLREMYQASIQNKPNYLLCKRMLHASCLAGMAFNLTGTAAGHALSFILSETWNIPHGTACAFTLNGIFELACTIPSTGKELAKISKHFHPEISNQSMLVQNLKKDIEQLTIDLKQPRYFKDLKIDMKPCDIDKNFERSFTDPKMHNQLPTAQKDNIYPLLYRLC